ncbi:MAG: hypothetical protein QF578_06170 [Alphaproteobacteria bacterium]|jgi:hypothetical protein|nr:hypothetical protein [Alphaproteobacteria bacterium]MDP6564395.1 hypothetical protein [Alphaproteobacteria bacterium]MDP6814810.1 hypothetical protein [Alphaproteobacteria bacterium]|tara:strand:+ start:128 stop:343 length:216 start_codon:yes stop_codon:yes gene_type:complete
MAKRNVGAAIGSLKALLSGDDDFVREAVRGYLQKILDVTACCFAVAIDRLKSSNRSIKPNIRGNVLANQGV